VGADPPHRVRPPIAPEGKVEADALAAPREIFGNVGAHAEQHLELGFSRPPPVRRGVPERMRLQPVVMGGDDRIEVGGARVPREHELDQPPGVRFDLGLAREGRHCLGGPVEGPQPLGGPPSLGGLRPDPGQSEIPHIKTPAVDNVLA